MTRHESLRLAESKAQAWFDEIAAQGLLRPGITEADLNAAAHELAPNFGFDKHWHKRIVRSGPNTMCPYAQNPQNRVIEEDDIVFFDFGPVLNEWEADFGRTMVVGDDPNKHRLVADIEECWQIASSHFHRSPGITGAELFEFVVNLATARGWSYAIEHAGHLIGKFPHERIQGEERRNYIHPDNQESLRLPDRSGNPRDWILELHFVDEPNQLGAFFEQLI